MQLNKKQGKFLSDTIQTWKNENVISSIDADKLNQSFQIRSFDWGRLAKYSFWIAIICTVIAVSAILADEFIIDLIECLFHSSGVVPCIIFMVFAIITYGFGLGRRHKYPQNTFSNEAIIFFGVLFTAVAIGYFGKAVDTGSGHYSLLFLLASVIYGALGLWFPSKLVWVFSLLSLGSWFGTETSYLSGGGSYYLGMNFPLRFVGFGLALLLLSLLFYRIKKVSDFAHSTKIMAMLYLFIALWILSIFGNYGDMHNWWYNSTHTELLIWGILFAVAALVAIVYGLKFDDASARGFGITFLFLNLYTKYFEYFWKDSHKAIFFIILAVSFWLIGRYAEKIWNLEFVKKTNE